MSISFYGYSQKETMLNIAKQQAQQLIIEKLKEHSYKNKIDGIKKNYVISFNDSMMIIFNLTEESNYYSVFKVDDVDSVSIEEKDYNVSLTLKLSAGRQVTTFTDFNSEKNATNFYQFILNLSFLSEELPEKIGDAFRRLTGFYD
ncbi:MAG: hypothetical protein Q8L81_10400 [Bacteroidota bacterium]|nr:hypothetical protein [Bacteroidota bacterium]